MPPRTRRSLRAAASPTPSTPATTNPPSIFSSRTSPADSSLSEIEDESPVKTRRRAVVKRKAQSDLDDEEICNPSRPATKRRALSTRAYVEVPVGRTRGAKLSKGTGITAIKGKGKATTVPENGSELSESELEYDENLSLADSDSSGSEFVASEAEMEDHNDFDASSDEEPLRAVARRSSKKYPTESAMGSEDEDADDVMLDAAIRLSREQAQGGDDAGPSSSRNVSSRVNPQALLRAAAAERGLSKHKETTFDVDDSVMDLDNLSSLSSDESDAPLAKGKGKGKGKGKAKARTKTKDPTRAEEKALRKKLGRKLTHAEKTALLLRANHEELRHVWGDLEAKIGIVEPVKAEQPSGIKLTLLPFQLESLYWMRKQEEGIWHGGMLADEMGMGKTIQIIALLVSDRKKPNLVVAPTVAIMQWRNEIEAHTDPNLRVLIWHGHSRESDIKELKKYDVVLTTYSVLESAFRKQEAGFKRKNQIIKEKSPVHQIKWERVILDEAHNIKERSTNTAKAAFELKAERRWCLSGTPLQNRVGELYSLVRFLGGDPFSYYFCKRCSCKSLHWKFSDKRTCDDCGHSPMQHTCFWNNEILTPIQKNGMIGPGKTAFKKLKILLDRMMLRRTKLQRADDLGLPPRTVIVRNDYFSPEEKELYLSLFSDAKRQFNTYLDQGSVLNNYSNIFSLLTRMRQMACHPDLVIRSKANAGKFVTQDVGEATVCRICNEVAEDAIQSKCRHIFDRECIKQYLNTAIEQTPACPVCFVPLTIDLEAEALDLEENLPGARQGILGRLDLDKWRSSTKIEALVEELSNLRNKDASTKSIVFSQFVNFLDLIAYRLKKAGFAICRLEGTMSPQARDATIKHFMNNVDVTVFLVSLKAGGVALNLTEASRVYLMDSWWNPAVEFQAMDRIHRLGQHRPVKAIKLVVEDSIESRIVQLQEKKSAMVDATLNPDDSAMGRLTPDDLQFLFRL
ncbi:DNA repair protein rad16 [Marasmius sp. AFHP31]|nr:DNA repair protein rad16 [Marasmius sp. AFHP31]